MEYTGKKAPEKVFASLLKWGEKNKNVARTILRDNGYSLKKVVEKMHELDPFPGVQSINDRGRNIIAKTLSVRVFDGKPKREVTEAWNDYESQVVAAAASAVGMDPNELPEYGSRPADDFTNPFGEEEEGETEEE